MWPQLSGARDYLVEDLRDDGLEQMGRVNGQLQEPAWPFQSEFGGRKNGFSDGVECVMENCRTRYAWDLLF